MKLITTICAIICASQSFAHGIEISDAYAISAGANAKVGAVFMAIKNDNPEDVILTGGVTDYSNVAEIHTHTMSADGVMKMDKIEGGLVIPAGKCTVLQRGGDHVMLMGLTKEMLDGEILLLTLNFEGTHSVDVNVKIDNTRSGDYKPSLPKGCNSSDMKMDHMSH